MKTNLLPFQFLVYVERNAKEGHYCGFASDTCFTMGRAFDLLRELVMEAFAAGTKPFSVKVYRRRGFTQHVATIFEAYNSNNTDWLKVIS